MSTHKYIDRICVVITVLALLLTFLFMNGEAMGLTAVPRSMAYENTLFDTSRVHTMDIVIDDWDAFLDTATSEEYAVCSVVIDNEAVKNVAIRGKGNTSLSTVASMGSERYSFKLEFDHFEDGKTYKGLDKLCLNNLIQDNTCMKDYLAYRLMAEFGADTPLCSYVWVTVNGEDWGLYLAVEAVEDSFLSRVYNSEGEIYKPDTLSMGGGGPGNGRDFDMEDFLDENADAMGFPWNRDADESESADDAAAAEQSGNNVAPSVAEGFTPPSGGGDEASSADGDGSSRPQMPGQGGEGQDGMPSFSFGEGSSFPGMPEGGEMPEGMEMPGGFGGGMPGGGFGVGSSDVKLQYSDDDPDSYSNIFDSSKTPVSNADKKRLIQSLKSLSEGENLEQVLDIDELLRYFVVHNYLVNSDSYTGSMVHNYYLHEEDGQFSMIPWDYNLAFGTFQGNDAAAAVNDPIDTPLSVSGDGSRPMADWIFRSEEYTELYHQYFAQFLDEVDIQAMIDETCALIAPYVEKDPTAFCSFSEFETGVDALKTFCVKRTESVRGQLDGTIPSTDAGQAADSSALIDASGLTLSDMGSMGGGAGGPGPGGNPFGEGGPGQDAAQQEAGSGGGEASSAGGGNGFGGQPPAAPGKTQGELNAPPAAPGGADEAAPVAWTDQGGMISQTTLLVSVAVLVGGLLAAFLYKRK